MTQCHLGQLTVEEYERRSEIPLLLLAGAFLVAYAWPVLDPRIDPDLAVFLDAVSWAVWIAFAVDFVIRLVLARDRRRYALRHWYDVVMIAVPLLRPLRLLRLLAFVRILNRSASGSFAGLALLYISVSAVIAVGLGALATLDAERGAEGANISTYGDAVWWACTTVTTVGYGDRYPVTLPGRIVAVLLMIGGITLVGAVTAGLATLFLSHTKTDEPTTDDSTAGTGASR